MPRFSIAAVLVMAFMNPAAAEEIGAFVCSFPEGKFVPWEAGKWTMESASSSSLTFAAIDPSRGSAQLIGNAGVADVTMITGLFAVHLVEITPGGNMNVTTIYSAQSDGKRPAVYSRHVSILSNPAPSQMWGTCEARTR